MTEKNHVTNGGSTLPIAVIGAASATPLYRLSDLLSVEPLTIVASYSARSTPSRALYDVALNFEAKPSKQHDAI